MDRINPLGTIVSKSVGESAEKLKTMGTNVGSGTRSKMRFSPLKAFFPTADDVIGAGLEYLGETFLRHLKTYEGGGTVHQPVGGFNRDYYIGVMEGRQLGLGPLPTQPEYADRQAQVSRRMQEAWNWAAIKGYLMRTPGQPHPDFFILTTEGERILEMEKTPRRSDPLGETGSNLAALPAQIATSAPPPQPTLRIEKTVFISYRRTAVAWARSIFQDLTHDGFDVFFDFNNIASGSFEEVILENIKARAHFLVLLTPTALDRCIEPGDLFRREIETAIESRRNIVPIFLDGFGFGSSKVDQLLGESLAPLKRYNGLPVPPEYFPEAMKRLREKYLNLPLSVVSHPASSLAEAAAREEQAAASNAPPVTEKDLRDAALSRYVFTVKLPYEDAVKRSEGTRAEEPYGPGSLIVYDGDLVIARYNEVERWSRQRA
jgi:TIR domain